MTAAVGASFDVDNSRESAVVVGATLGEASVDINAGPTLWFRSVSQNADYRIVLFMRSGEHPYRNVRQLRFDDRDIADNAGFAAAEPPPIPAVLAARARN